jgi:hypothetical protein
MLTCFFVSLSNIHIFPSHLSVPPTEPAKVPGIPLQVVDKKAQRGKEGVREALKLTQFSTASMGRGLRDLSEITYPTRAWPQKRCP